MECEEKRDGQACLELQERDGSHCWVNVMLKMPQTRSHRKTVEKIIGLNTEQKGLKCINQ